MAVTNLYCSFKFYSDNEKFNLKEFKNEFNIDMTRSWSIGDPWKVKNNEVEATRIFSSAVMKSQVSDDYDGEAVINDFFDYLHVRKESIISMKQKYKAETFFEIVTNLKSRDMPIISLTSKQLELLSLTGTELGFFTYDYR